MALIKCPECGKEISDKAKSCPNCGCPICGEIKVEGKRFSELSEETVNYAVRYRQPIDQKMKNQKKLEREKTASGPQCPHCKGKNLQAISDVEGKGASFWKLCFCGLLGLCGTGKTTTTHYWVCKDCGYKFKM